VHITFERDGDISRVRRMVWAASRKNMRRVWIMAGVFGMLGLLFAANGWGFGGALIGLAVVYALLPWWAVSRQVRRVRPFFAETATYTITEADVTVDTEAYTQTFRWPGFLSVREVNGFWICLNKAKLPAVIIPQDCMRPEDLLALRTFLATSQMTPATYRL